MAIDYRPGDGPYRAQTSRAVTNGSRGNVGVTQVVHQMRAERSRLMLMRASFAVVAIASGLGLLWVLPWFPVGLTFDNYSGPAAGAVILATLSGSGALAFLLVWGASFRNEPLPEFLRVLLGGHQLIRGRAQFYSRLAAECKRARKDRRYLFSVVMVQRGPSVEQHDWLEPGREQDVAAMLVRGVVRADDVVATSPGALYVLATGAGDEARERVVQRLIEVLHDFDEPLGLTGARAIGSATFGEDGDSPELLLFAIKQRMRPVTEIEEAQQAPVSIAAAR